MHSKLKGSPERKRLGSEKVQIELDTEKILDSTAHSTVHFLEEQTHF